MALYASDVKIPANLSGAISGVGSPGYNAAGGIQSNYAAARKRLPSTIDPNSYASNRLNTQQGLDTGNLEATLGQGLGGTSYNNALEQRGYNQSEQLAREAAALNKPDMLQEILSGIGSIGGTAATIYGASGGKKGPPSAGGFNANGPMSLYNPNQSGYGRYSGGY